MKLAHLRSIIAASVSRVNQMQASCCQILALLLTPAQFKFKGRSLRRIKLVIDERISDFISRAAKFSGSAANRAVKHYVGSRLHFLAADIVSQVCLRREFGCDANDRGAHGFYSNIKNAVPLAEQVPIFPEVSGMLHAFTKIALIKSLLIPKSSDTEGLERVMRVSLVRSGSSRTG